LRHGVLFDDRGGKIGNKLTYISPVVSGEYELFSETCQPIITQDSRNSTH